MAATLVLKEQYPEAIDYLKKALTINPEDTALYTNLAIILKRQGDLVDARHHLLRALEINPANASARRHLEEIDSRMREEGGIRKD